MTDAGINLNADPGYHLYSLETIRTDINTGDKTTNTVYFPTTQEDYVRSFSTNLEDLVGDNRIEAMVEEDAEPSCTSNGIPYSWLEQYGITNTNDSVEQENNDLDLFNNLQEWIAQTDPTNSADFFAINIDGANPEIQSSKTNRFYSYDYATNLTDTWSISTNWITGNGSNLLLSPVANKIIFYRGKVKE